MIEGMAVFGNLAGCTLKAKPVESSMQQAILRILSNEFEHNLYVHAHGTLVCQQFCGMEDSKDPVLKIILVL